MGFSRLFLFIGLPALVLPWAGCQYIREMDAAVRQGHAQSLIATAQAVAARLSTDPELAQELRQRVLVDAQQPVIYAHPLQSEPILDGYHEEWAEIEGTAEAVRTLADGRWRAELLAASHDTKMYLWLDVADPTRQSFSPGTDLQRVDHLRLILPRPVGEDGRYAIFTAAPGEAQVFTYRQGYIMRREHRIKAWWQERGDGYRVEVRLPMAWLSEGLVWEVYDGASRSVVLTSGSSPRTVIAPSAVLEQTLAVFSGQSKKLTLVSQGGYWLASAGELSGNGDRRAGEARPFRYVVRDLFTAQRYPVRPALSPTGQVSDSVAIGALNGAEGFDWYEFKQTLVTRVAAPVILSQNTSGIPVAAIVAEQTTRAAGFHIDSAALRLLLYSGGMVVLLALLMLLHGFLLSYRIRRLKRAVDHAIDTDGRVIRDFKASRRSGELGELSRSCQTLLSRLREYNGHLEDLVDRLCRELRTPLALVRSSLDNLSESLLPQDSEDYLARAQEGAARLSAILDTMGAVARVEQSLRFANVERVDVVALVDELYRRYRQACPDKQVTLVRACSGPVYAELVPPLFGEMLDRLVENANELSGDGEHIELRLTADGFFVVLQVANSGSHVPVAMQERIFDPLVSARDSNGSQQHLGLGLYIVRLVAKFHGGEVSAYNDEGRGMAVFEVRLPRG